MQNKNALRSQEQVFGLLVEFKTQVEIDTNTRKCNSMIAALLLLRNNNVICLKDLTVTLTSERTIDEVELVEDSNESCALNPQSFVDEQEWRLHKIILTWCRTRTDDNKSSKTIHSAFSAACKASRRPEFFIWNILVVMVNL